MEYCRSPDGVTIVSVRPYYATMLSRVYLALAMGFLVIVRQMQKKFRAKGKKLYFGFMDLEKAFNMVPREVIRWAMCKLGVERLVLAVMFMYTGAKTVERNGLW